MNAERIRDKMKCQQCDKKMKKIMFDIGYDTEVNTLHCENCGMNCTDERVLEMALNTMQKKIAKESVSQSPPEPF